jgi:hypothetical protein
MAQPPTKNQRKQVKRNTDSINVINDRDNPVFRRISENPPKSGGRSTRAICDEDAGPDNTIATTLFKADGTEGEAVIVHCNIANGSALNEASPLLEIGLVIYVQSINIDNAGTPEQQWECVTPFMTFEECTCGS